MFHRRRQHTINLFCKDIRKTKKELQGVPVSKASAIILKKWKKVKANEKKMKKYKDLYEEEEQRHEEALQRYQEDHADETQIIKLHKKCNKKDRKVLQPKVLSKSDEPIDDPSKEEQKPKKIRWKKDHYKGSKKVKKAPQPEKAPKTSEFLDTDSDDSDDEQEPIAEQLQKASKNPEFVGTGSGDEQQPAVKKLQKGLKIPKFAAAGCTHILISGVRKGKQCRSKASDETSKFCYHHKPNKHEIDQK